MESSVRSDYGSCGADNVHEMMGSKPVPGHHSKILVQVFRETRKRGNTKMEDKISIRKI
jgi:hypothetical protein